MNQNTQNIAYVCCDKQTTGIAERKEFKHREDGISIFFFLQVVVKIILQPLVMPRDIIKQEVYGEKPETCRRTGKLFHVLFFILYFSP